MTSTTNASYSCLCGAVRGDGISFKATHLPVECGFCLCDDCRYQIGGMFCAGIPLKDVPSEDVLAKCTRYDSSGKLSRYFCTTCGSFCFVVKPGGVALVGEGCMNLPPDSTSTTDVMKLSLQYWADDTHDYKIASRLLKVGGRDIPIYSRDHRPEDVSLTTEQVLKIAGNIKRVEPSSSDRLEARCHCGGIDLRLSRPDWKRYEKPLIPPDGHKHKFHADFCACSDCRKADGGASIAPWMDVPVENLTDASGKQVTFSPKGTSIVGLIEYESTKGQVVRSSCKTCGARVFFWSADKPDMCLLAPGLLRAPEGAAASNWVWWRCAISRRDETIDREITEAMLDQECLLRTQ